MIDDPIGDAELLWRRCVALDLKEDGSAKSSLWRTEEVSVHRAGLLPGDRETALTAIAATDGCVAVFEVTAGALRTLGFVVEPLTEGHSPDHAIIKGIANQKKAQKVRDLANKVWPKP